MAAVTRAPKPHTPGPPLKTAGRVAGRAPNLASGLASGPDIRIALGVAVACGLTGLAAGGPVGLAAPALAALPLLLLLRQWIVLLALGAAMPALYAGFTGLGGLAAGGTLHGAAAVAANLAAYVCYFLLKLAPLGAVFVAVCRTSRLGQLLAALEWAGLPRPAVLAVAVTFRFVPTLLEEYGHIRDALALRRGRGLWRRNPLRVAEELLLPLLVRSARLADELAASALTRGIEAPEALPARLPRPGLRDALALGWAVAVLAATLGLRRFS